MNAKLEMRLSAVEKKILNITQEDIPLTRQPFKILAERAGISEKRLLSGIDGLKKKGILRNYAAGINHKRVGFKSTLLGLKVDPHRIESLAKEVVVYPEVTHCFQREGEYNLWLVFICPRRSILRNFLNRLARKIGKENILNLPTKRQFKLKTKIKI